MKPRHRILSIVGARPNFVKLAPMSAALDATGGFEHIIVHTGQHYSAHLSADLFKELAIPNPQHNLGVGSGRQAWQLGQMVAALDEILEKEEPDLVLVYGDTNSTAAGAIAAAKNHIPVGYVEAGLREFDKAIPEEVNKLLTTAVADLYFCPTATAVRNLEEIGIRAGIHLVGDVGIDLIFNNLDKIARNQAVLERFGVKPDKFYFFTCHRASNTDSPASLEAILAALAGLELPVVFTLHPRTEEAIRRFGLPHPADLTHVKAVPPIGFFDAQALIRSARAVITDSGGVLKEAYFHRTPGIIIDRQTEWVETVAEGWNHIAGPVTDRILDFARKVEVPHHHTGCLGDGTAANKIAAILKKYLDAPR